MIDHIKPLYIILTGFILVLMGCVLPFLMVIKTLESTFFLNFASHIASVLGLFLGIVGASMYVRKSWKK